MNPEVFYEDLKDQLSKEDHIDFTKDFIKALSDDMYADRFKQQIPLCYYDGEMVGVIKYKIKKEKTLMACGEQFYVYVDVENGKAKQCGSLRVPGWDGSGD